LWYNVENGGDKMLCNRIKQFREYNGLKIPALAEVLGISESLYRDFEAGRAVPTIDIIEKLAVCYKVSVDEFYGYTPRLSIHDKSYDLEDSEVDESLLRMSNLSWDEAQLILYYRSLEDKDSLIEEIIKKNQENK
jgi:transcriptional regulator with XRE-family HTH domain